MTLKEVIADALKAAYAVPHRRGLQNLSLSDLATDIEPAVAQAHGNLIDRLGIAVREALFSHERNKACRENECWCLPAEKALRDAKKSLGDG